ncbi:MAG: DUF3465 domain-containing protein, partial [Thiotrichaceae bacterium]|nr:DUF3465 domain-containing protein [Thiotrichaceae bacterium]
MSRKPIVGDVIHYEISLDANGKSRAVNAKIEGVEQVLTLEPLKQKRKKYRSKPINKKVYRKSTNSKKSLKSFKLLTALIVIIVGVVLNAFLDRSNDFLPSHEGLEQKTGGVVSQRLTNAYKNQQSDVQVDGKGFVIRILSDDTQGSQHQRFILKLSSGQTLLIAHNIDLAPRINSLLEGDVVEFYGEYEWNSKGG